MNTSFTPINKLFGFEENEVFIKRDDLYPFFFGGNKVRIAEEFFLDMKKQKKNCIIGYGNSRSNMCRAIANVAYSDHIPCYIISPKDDDGTRTETSNSRIVNECGAIIRICDKKDVAGTVNMVLNECKAKGYDPYYIYGDIYGKGNEAVPVRAYKKVYYEMIEQMPDLDYIFLPTGTGMTQAGLLCGKQKHGGGCKIIGISVARRADMEKQVITGFLNASGLKDDAGIYVDDSFLCGGYGKYCMDELLTIKQMYREYGIPLDPTYTGKAFWGMLEWLKKNGISNKKILFLHTGGTLLFSDHLNSKLSLPDVCKEKDELTEFLREADLELPVSLSKRVDLRAYADKVLRCGKNVVIRENGKIVAAALFYCNDSETGQGYLTLLVTLGQHKRKGYASLLMDAAESMARNSGMKEFLLDTNKENAAAISFYRDRDYRVIFEEEKIRMGKQL